MEALTLLVTGSRKFADPGTVNRCLDMCMRPAARLGLAVHVWHGKCEKGPDAYADAWAVKAQTTWQAKHPAVPCPVELRRFPAQWQDPCREQCHHGPRGQRWDGTSYCQMAGFYRNQDMIDAAVQVSPVVVIGFWRGGSSGTRDCLDRAKTAGLPIATVTWERRHSAGLVVRQLTDALAVALRNAAGEEGRTQANRLLEAVAQRTQGQRA